ncbi:uncharacterized protein LOC130736214 [Lotus japonicus]|uniref:uncharacterized protein LOC130736214 n=1 Tax=Lotus japonicus TaxID=34305 RepID=UPI0025858085|nr:uncharacterized protein LOC130736214 [Lotus japonicus]
MGTKSLPRLIDEKKKLGKGVSPKRKDIYIQTRTRKDGTIVNEKAAREELKKHNEAETSQSTQNTQRHTSWNEDIFSKVQGLDKRGRIRCMGKIPKCKKIKASSSENEELRDRMKHMENLLTNVLTLIQNRLPGEDLNERMDAARRVSDASSAPNHLNSPSSNANEDDEYDEDAED